MDAEGFRERVEEEMATELDRLGSSKLLIALTDAELTEAAVLDAAAASEAAARETFEQWAAGEDDETARATFADLADQEAGHYERIAEQLDADVEADADRDDGAEAAEPAAAGDAAGPLHAYLRGLEGTADRAAGVVGRGLVSDRTHLQLIGFFVDEGSTELADLFRELRAETEEATDAGLDLLAANCETEDDWEAAVGVATYTIQVAYDDYADALAAMDMDPKPIC